MAELARGAEVVEVLSDHGHVARRLGDVAGDAMLESLGSGTPWTVGCLTSPPGYAARVIVPRPDGDFGFLTGIAPYSSGAVADAGFEVVHVTMGRLAPYREGLGIAVRHLESVGRPIQALCGIELRIPAPMTLLQFDTFNAEYRDVLAASELLVDGANPIVRTNVAPVHRPPAEPSLFGFSYTVPGADERPAFVVAGAGELLGATLLPEAVVRPGETSPEALLEKMEVVMTTISERLRGLGAGWADVTAVGVYTAEPAEGLVSGHLAQLLGVGGSYGITWHVSRPPLDYLAFEMDARGVARELILR
jgi:hypothetical protein